MLIRALIGSLMLNRQRSPRAAAVVVVALWIAVVGPVLAQGPDDDWHPESDYEGKFDWIQMKSGEWVKGKIIVMYDDDLEFDSDEFDDLVLDWDKIKLLRSSQVVQVGLVHDRNALGILIVDGDRISVVGEEETLEFPKADVLTLTAGRPKEINYWSMKFFLGVVVRKGNSDVREINLQVNLKRRTINNRLTFDFIGNENTTDDVQIADNQRATFGWDKFINRRFFVNPFFGEYFRDPFQNIETRVTGGVGAGYQLLDSSKVEWEVSGGPAYQETQFTSVEPGSPPTETTPAMVINTNSSWDITRWLEFDGTYRIQFVNEESGTYNHHLVASFETEITKLIEFDVSWIWDRIQDPRPNEAGIVPNQDDFRTTVGLTFDF